LAKEYSVNLYGQVRTVTAYNRISAASRPKTEMLMLS